MRLSLSMSVFRLSLPDILSRPGFNNKLDLMSWPRCSPAQGGERLYSIRRCNVERRSRRILGGMTVHEGVIGEGAGGGTEEARHTARRGRREGGAER